MIDLTPLGVWLVPGSQRLYGPDTLARAAEHAQVVARALDDAARACVGVVA